MSQRLPTIEEFRKRVIGVMVSKGIQPPVPDSSEEENLFNNWLVGWKKLNQWKE